MPGVVEQQPAAKKRKRERVGQSPSKRTRANSDQDDVHTRIALLESDIFQSRKNYNNITVLLGLVKAANNDEDQMSLSVVALCRIFMRLLAQGALIKTPDTAEKDVVVVQWLRHRLNECKTLFLHLLSSVNMGSTALTLLMRLLKSEGTYPLSGAEYQFPVKLLTDLVSKLVESEIAVELREEFAKNFVEEYDDIRFYTFETISKLLHGATETSNVSIDAIFTIISSIESVPEKKDDLEDFYTSAPKQNTHQLYSLTAHKKRAQAAWLAVLQMHMSKEQRKSLLSLIATNVAPWFLKPELLMDFLTDSYDAGGSTSLQALSGVFYLIQERNLDYPQFYKKLYSLLDLSLLNSKHRSKFFRLLDTFLSSSHLPAVLVASFIKRLSRLALSAPPAAVVAMIPYIYNVLQKHPTCTFMIHREIHDAETKKSLNDLGMSDPFDAIEEDPMESDAISSSLWEIETLQSHYHPNVATLAKIISEQFTKHAYNLEDFLDHSYGSLLETELSKSVKKEPAIEFEIPKKIFLRRNDELSSDDNILARLWTFE